MSQRARPTDFKKMSRTIKVARCLHRRPKLWRNVFHREKIMDRVHVAYRERRSFTLWMGMKTRKHVIWWRTKGSRQDDGYDDIRKLVSETHLQSLPSPRNLREASKAREAMARAEAWIAQEKEKTRARHRKEDEEHKQRLKRHDMRRNVLIREARRCSDKV